MFQETLGLEYSDLGLLNNALVHSSYINECRDGSVTDNERLEFLGDSVLSLAVSDWLYNNVTGGEGSYSKIRCIVVSEDTLYKVALKLSPDRYILLGKGEESTGGRKKKAVLADATEALFASIYLDKGFAVAREFILKQMVPEIKLVIQHSSKRDYKTLLQEYVQKMHRIVPEYKMVSRSGPEHDPKFFYTVSFKGHVFGPASGHNKKDAEQNVAELAYKELKIQD